MIPTPSWWKTTGPWAALVAPAPLVPVRLLGLAGVAAQAGREDGARAAASAPSMPRLPLPATRCSRTMRPTGASVVRAAPRHLRPDVLRPRRQRGQRGHCRGRCVLRLGQLDSSGHPGECHRDRELGHGRMGGRRGRRRVQPGGNGGWGGSGLGEGCTWPSALIKSTALKGNSTHGVPGALGTGARPLAAAGLSQRTGGQGGSAGGGALYVGSGTVALSLSALDENSASGTGRHRVWPPSWSFRRRPDHAR